MELPPPTGAGPESTGTEQERSTSEHDEAERRHSPRIYVASLSDYVNGILYGVWLDADQDPDDLRDAVLGMLESSPTGHGEEFAIHDFEGFGDYHPGEYDSFDRISRIGRGVVEHGLAFAAWAAEVGDDDDRLERFDEAFLGDWSSVESYADELLSDLGYDELLEKAMPDWLQPYVSLDVEGFARDLQLGGDISVSEHEGGVWIFHPDVS